MAWKSARKEFAYTADIEWNYGKQGIPAADLKTTLARVIASLEEHPTFVKSVQITRVLKPDWLIREEMLCKSYH